ncbi:MAG: DUF4296 domain-containing protein [Bacteroidetes bacterium]|nr:DUF4296 domain-containing protein [Bacteroidota bacterium]
MKFLSFILIGVIFISCRSQQSKPADLLPVDSMKVIVWDLIQGGEMASIEYPGYKDSFNIQSMILFEKILAGYGLDKKTFFKSFDYYAQHPDENKILFDSIQKYGERHRIRIYQEVK